MLMAYGGMRAVNTDTDTDVLCMLYCVVIVEVEGFCLKKMNSIHNTYIHKTYIITYISLHATYNIHTTS